MRACLPETRCPGLRPRTCWRPTRLVAVWCLLPGRARSATTAATITTAAIAAMIMNFLRPGSWGGGAVAGRPGGGDAGGAGGVEMGGWGPLAGAATGADGRTVADPDGPSSSGRDGTLTRGPVGASIGDPATVGVDGRTVSALNAAVGIEVDGRIAVSWPRVVPPITSFQALTAHSARARSTPRSLSSVISRGSTTDRSLVAVCSNSVCGMRASSAAMSTNTSLGGAPMSLSTLRHRFVSAISCGSEKCSTAWTSGFDGITPSGRWAAERASRNLPRAARSFRAIRCHCQAIGLTYSDSPGEALCCCTLRVDIHGNRG